MVSQCTKYEVSRFTRYEAVNGDAKCRKWGGQGALKVNGNVTIRQSAYDFLFDFNRNHAPTLYRLRDIASYLSKVAVFDPPHLHSAPSQGVTPVKFRGDLWHQKTRVFEVSCVVVCVILRLAVLVELLLVTDGHRHGPMASTADAQHRVVIIESPALCICKRNQPILLLLTMCCVIVGRQICSIHLSVHRKQFIVGLIQQPTACMLVTCQPLLLCCIARGLAIAALLWYAYLPQCCSFTYCRLVPVTYSLITEWRYLPLLVRNSRNMLQCYTSTHFHRGGNANDVLVTN